MRNCEKYREMTEAYIDGFLSDAEKAEFEEHINSCSECREELEFSRAVRSELKKIELPSPPPDFLDRVNAAIDAEIGENKKSKKIYAFFGRRSISAIAACALIAVFLGVNADNELTKKISINDEISDMVFKDIIKQDANTASELLPGAGSSEAADKTAEAESKNAAAGAEIKTETKKQNSEPEKKSEKITQKESKAEETAVGSAAVAEKNEEAPMAQKEEGAAAESEGAADVVPFTCSPVANDIPENDLIGSGGSGSSDGAGKSSSDSEISSKMVPNERQAIAIVFDSVFTVTVDNAEAAKKIADEICHETDGAYSMTAAEYASFIEALHNAEIGYSSDAPDNEDVRIVLEGN